MTDVKCWTIFEAARYINGELQESISDSYLSGGHRIMVDVEDYNALVSRLEVAQLQLESWRSAYTKITAGDHAEVRLDTDGAIDEVVGSGVFHVEQMDTNRWFFDLAGCRFNIDGKKVTLTPIESDTWSEEQRRVAT